MTTVEFSKKQNLMFIVPEECGSGIQRIAKKVMQDICGTTGYTPQMCNEYADDRKTEQAVIAVTEGQSLAEELAQRFPELKEVKGKRECYGFLIRKEPVEGVSAGVIIYGSDKLGTIYGLFHISELLGVMPFLFWGDCPYTEKEKVILSEADSFISREPSVEYRGFFINDEWPCFGNWTTSHFGGFTVEMYDHILEYLLRMKGNYLWPAMWSSCFMLDGPDMESMKLADEYGIYIGMSHHEPCMRSGGEYSKVRGSHSPYGDAWDYVKNKEGILKFWEDGIKRSVGHHVFPTVGMRGENDSKMLGEDSLISDNVRLLKEIITKQKEMIHTYLEKDEKTVPKLFAVYKEVEDYYFGGGTEEGLRGFEDLDDVTLLLCDDNFGNMRALPEKFERDHKGGFGMYYHLDYHGDPVSYEWVASTPLNRIWEQMTETWEYGVRKLWIVNVGDVKFQEFPLNYFMNLAYDFDTWGSEAPNSTGAYTEKWIKDTFGEYTSADERREIRDVLEGYLRLNGLRRPESLNDTVYHPAHELECERILTQCEILEKKNESVRQILRSRGKENAYYSMIYFSAAASVNLLKMQLYSGKNHLYANQGKAVANLYGEMTEQFIKRDEELAQEMADFKNGKWAGMELASHIGFTNWNDEDWRYPVKYTVRLPQKPRLVVSRADETVHYTNQYFPNSLIIEDFSWENVRTVKLQIANGGQGTVHWNIVKGARKVGMDGVSRESDTAENCEWIGFSAMSGETKLQDEVTLIIKKENLPFNKMTECSFEIRTDTEFIPVIVKTEKKESSQIPDHTFVPENGIYAINAQHFSEKAEAVFENQMACFKTLDHFGKYEGGMKVFPVTAYFTEKEKAPSLTYQLWSEKEEENVLELHTSPANPLIYGGRLHMGVSVNQEVPVELCITGEKYKGGEPGCRSWEEAVLNQEHKTTLKINLKKGMNQIQIYAREAGIVLERLVVYNSRKLPETSYLGPEESKWILNGEVR